VPVVAAAAVPGGGAALSPCSRQRWCPGAELPRARALARGGGGQGEPLDGVEPCGCEREAVTRHAGGEQCDEA
jgi:hypothetical protein